MIIKISKKFKYLSILSASILVISSLYLIIVSVIYHNYLRAFIFILLFILWFKSMFKTIKILKKCYVKIDNDKLIINQIVRRYRKTNFIERFLQPYIYWYSNNSTRDCVIDIKTDEILFKEITKCDYKENLHMKINGAYNKDLIIIGKKKYIIPYRQFTKKDLDFISNTINKYNKLDI